MNIIEARDLTFIYDKKSPNPVRAVDGVSFDVKKGEVLGIIGHTGSGKSTLVQLFNGLLKPFSGTVRLSDNDIWTDPKKIRNIRFKVGLVFQYPEYQLFEETVGKDIAYGPKNMGLSQSEISKRVQEAMDFTGLDYSLVNKSPFELSGGEKRRAAIAGIVAMQPEVLVLDEPTAGLDPQGRNAILGKLKELHENTGNTVIMVSHSMEEVAMLADRILVMSKGKVLMLDTVRNVFSRADELEKAGLSVPQITSICRKLKMHGMKLSDGIFTVEQACDEIKADLGGQA